MRRHDIAFVRPSGWRRLLQARSDLAADPLVGPWVEKRRPLVVRRTMPGEASGVPLGLPLPPSAGKRRLAFVMRRDDVAASYRPPPLRLARWAAPSAWQPTLEALGELAAAHGIDLRIFGSLAWQILTGLGYLTKGSDLDLLLNVSRHTDLAGLTTDLAAIEAQAPMRVDGELVRGDGAAVNWREFHAGSHEILVKTVRSVGLTRRSDFLLEDAPA
jgi:phosphoribosyl-dephospho-CoA transferase